MKFLITFSVLFACSQLVFAQKRLHFSFEAGATTSQFPENLTHSTVSWKANSSEKGLISPVIGANIHWRFGKKISLMSGLYYQQSGNTYHSESISSISGSNTIDFKLKFHEIALPLIISYPFNVKSFRFKTNMGLRYVKLVAGKSAFSAGHIPAYDRAVDDLFDPNFINKKYSNTNIFQFHSSLSFPIFSKFELTPAFNISPTERRVTEKINDPQCITNDFVVQGIDLQLTLRYNLR